MYVRLAFSVAAHLEPEILIVDEVLAVGDLAFQRKCMGKMEEVSQGGRTILFVSHSMPAVTRLCTRCVLLRAGHAEMSGPTYDVVGAYLKTSLQKSSEREWEPDRAPGSDVVRLRAVRVRSTNAAASEVFDIRKPVGIDVAFDVIKAGWELTPNLHVFDEAGHNVFISHDVDPAWRKRPRPTGRYISTAWIPGNLLAEGTFLVGASITTMTPPNIHVYEREAVAFQIVDSMDGDSARQDFAGHLPGIVRPLLHWETRYVPELIENPPLVRGARAKDVGRY
jgi:lipopolysaccharide transport system ATP-binding protein